jgi:hypothetical protein
MNNNYNKNLRSNNLIKINKLSENNSKFNDTKEIQQMIQNMEAKLSSEINSQNKIHEK